MADPEAKGVAAPDAERALSRVLAHRVWTDQRRGWRFTNPSLAVLEAGPRRVRRPRRARRRRRGVREPRRRRCGLCLAERRAEAFRILFEVMLEGLAVGPKRSNPRELEAHRPAVAQPARGTLGRSTRKETPRDRDRAAARRAARQDTRLRDEQAILRGGPRSRLARELNRASVWGRSSRGDDYLAW